MTLTGKKALVTGGSRGIGAAIALLLAERGCDVAITYASAKEAAEALVSKAQSMGRTAIALCADAADPTAVRQAVDQAAKALGGLDILVNNAGIGRYGTLRELSEDDIDAQLAINIKGVIAATQRALAHLGHGGRVINIGSCLANRVPAPGFTVYAMTKAALDGFTRGLARELGSSGITVNVVHPGPTDTDANPSSGPQADFQRQLTATGSYGTPADVAHMVAFLAQPSSGQLTGSAFAVDGGTNA